MQDLEKKKCTWFIMETCTKLHTTYIRYIKYWNMALSKCLINFSNNWFKSNKCSYSRSAVWWVINRKMTHKKCTDHMQIKTYEIRILFSAWLTHKIKPLTDSRVRWNMNLQICFYPFFFLKKIQFLKVLISMSLTIGSMLIFYRVFWCCMLIFYRVFTTVAVRPKFYAEYSPDQ